MATTYLSAGVAIVTRCPGLDRPIAVVAVSDCARCEIWMAHAIDGAQTAIRRPIAETILVAVTVVDNTAVSAWLVDISIAVFIGLPLVTNLIGGHRHTIARAVITRTGFLIGTRITVAMDAERIQRDGHAQALRCVAPMIHRAIGRDLAAKRCLIDALALIGTASATDKEQDQKGLAIHAHTSDH